MTHYKIQPLEKFVEVIKPWVIKDFLTGNDTRLYQTNMGEILMLITRVRSSKLDEMQLITWIVSDGTIFVELWSMNFIQDRVRFL